MSNKAVDNSKLEEVNDLQLKISDLEEEVIRLKNELEKQKEINKSIGNEKSVIFTEFTKLKDEVYNFENLSGKNKLKQLNVFKKNVKIMVDRFGKVIEVKPSLEYIE